MHTNVEVVVKMRRTTSEMWTTCDTDDTRQHCAVCAVALNGGMLMSRRTQQPLKMIWATRNVHCTRLALSVLPHTALYEDFRVHTVRAGPAPIGGGPWFTCPHTNRGSSERRSLQVLVPGVDVHTFWDPLTVLVTTPRSSGTPPLGSIAGTVR